MISLRIPSDQGSPPNNPYLSDNPLGLIHKCEMCVERLAEGELPACVSGCPAGALAFGRRSDLLVQAHARINSNPGRYIDQVYGEFEAGGTSAEFMQRWRS